MQNQAQVHQYAADYYRPEALGRPDHRLQGPDDRAVVDATPASKYVWWSNRGDDDDSTLTRTVDLTQVPTATLTFSTWYNIENGYDYVYVEASTDGGRHWQILPGQHTNSNDKSGNAYGPGWTGKSGGGDTPAWIQEQVDLTPFAGKQIQLRFEYVTDDAVNGPGFLLDNIAIPADRLPRRWRERHQRLAVVPAGSLTDNTLDQRWLVQVVETTPEQRPRGANECRAGWDRQPVAARDDQLRQRRDDRQRPDSGDHRAGSLRYTITQQTARHACRCRPAAPLPRQPSPVPRPP